MVNLSCTIKTPPKKQYGEFTIKDPLKTPIHDFIRKISRSQLKTRVFTCQQCEYSSSGSDVSVNAVIIPKNWWAIPSEGRSPEEGYCSPILRNDDRIHQYI